MPYSIMGRCEGCRQYAPLNRIKALPRVHPGGYLCHWCRLRLDPYVRDPLPVWNHAVVEGAYR